MKKISFLKGMSWFFSGVGVLVTVGLIFVMVTNASGLGILFSVIGLIKSQALYEVNTEQMLEGASAGIVESLDDPYSSYLDKEAWQDLKVRLQAKFGGIGVYILEDEHGRIVIYSPIKGTPAYEKGIQHGDIVVKINGESTMNMTSDDAAQLMRGDPGTQLELTIYRESESKEYTFKIIREEINIPSVEEKVLDSEAGIGYIKLSQFHAQSAQEMNESVNRLIKENKVKSLILDLRNNGGGDFNAAVAIAGIFLDNETVVSVLDNDGRRDEYQASAGSVEIPLVVLVNQVSASASEILAAALQDNQRAVLVGETTYGKGLVQTVFELQNGGALKLTTQKYLTPRGTDINEIGIKADYEVAPDQENTEDTQLNKALQVIKEMQGLQ